MEELLSNLFSVSSNTVPARAQFVGRYVARTTFNAVAIGISCGVCMAGICGPIVPFFIGSWCAYTFSACRFFQEEVARAVEYACKYPRLMDHAHQSEFPFWVSSSGKSFAEQIRDGGFLIRSWGILAAQNVEPAVRALQEDERQRIVDSYKTEE